MLNHAAIAELAWATVRAFRWLAVREAFGQWEHLDPKVQDVMLASVVWIDENPLAEPIDLLEAWRPDLEGRFVPEESQVELKTNELILAVVRATLDG